MDFGEIMRKVQEQMLDGFKLKIEGKSEMHRNEYLSTYLGHFLGDFPPNSSVAPREVFDSFCHNYVDSVSLCGPEIKFFHAMIDLPDNSNYIQSCLDLYSTFRKLPMCQLGGNIKQFLEVSLPITITF